jgi:c-di-GMP-binding flagellar brake protein YcgR
MHCLLNESAKWFPEVESEMIHLWDALWEGQGMLWGVVALSSLILMAVFHWSRQALRHRQVAQLYSMVQNRLVLPECIPPGTAVLIEVLLESEIKRVRGTIEAIQPRGSVITVLLRDCQMAVPPGTPLIVIATLRSAAYRFHVSVVECRLLSDTWKLSLTRPEWVERVQRRTYFRVPVKLPTTISPMRPSSAVGTLLRGEIWNLSGGGVGVATMAAISPGTLIRVRVPLPTIGEAGFDARVMQCRRLDGETSFHFLVQCEFLYISEETRALLINYCFDVERDLMRKKVR